ncbi:unnamed protein product [Chironomus riparius]|uniref:Uncharacterized protein n=1 Tax=Chironomus riparius TaxID=315576 RepID=A0A9N9S033_9DIPT|nr:unnamed protein product [Chironomus riparius]
MFIRQLFIVFCILMMFYVNSNMGAATGSSNDDNTEHKQCNSGVGKCVPFLLCKETFEEGKNSGDSKTSIDNECTDTYELCCRTENIKDSID